jgi:thiosulfate/3-mercaptopyruvate sulfurtransferase
VARVPLSRSPDLPVAQSVANPDAADSLLSTPLTTPLISVGALVELLATGPAPALLDVRWELGGRSGALEFAEGHVPGAAFVDLDRELAGPPGSGGRHPLPSADDFAASMRAAGVRNRQTVVVYDEASSTAAARAWWLLRFYGHAEVAVLDGGFAAWVAADPPIETGHARVQAGDFDSSPGAMATVDADGAGRLARNGVLLDARAPERFSGQREPIDPVAGHIPGARNHPTLGNVDQAGRFLPAERLREGFRRAGVTTETAIGAYCGSGITAAHQVLALELAGYPASLYPGSWSEWITDPNRPVATGQ